jgi:peptide/nickel transport system ATP-binding protein
LNLKRQYLPREREHDVSKLLVISDLRVSVAAARSELLLLDRVSLEVKRGDVLGIVGESGSGKSMLSLTILGLLPPGVRIAGGAIGFDGMDLTSLNRARLNQIRGARLSMIFQEPMTALNPMMRVGDQITEAVAAHSRQPHDALVKKVMDALAEVGLTPPDRIARLYPHQLSGGMRQRVMIAMAIVCSPDLIIADEPTTALDVTVQAQILTLLRSIVDRRGCALILISHDIGVINTMADRVAVMYGGSIVEECAAGEFLNRARHPYTRLLLDSYVDIDLEPMKTLPTISGSMPMADEKISGCRFHPRCPICSEICRQSHPQIAEIGAAHRVSCHNVGAPS